ncbi:MAG: class I SAM-dependent methyltransferase [Alphaproteobacteria bacterium]
MTETTTPVPALAEDPAGFWDQRYADSDYFYGTAPNAWLVTQKHRLKAGQAVLAVADGEGRNGVWLAEQGCKVTAVDASPKAQAKAAALAQKHGVGLTLHTTDLRSWDWPAGRFDVVVAIYAHFRRWDRPVIHAKMLQALVPGGLVLIQAFSPYQRLYQSGGPPDLDMLYSAYRLREDFRDADILELDETETTLDEGRGHRGRAAVTSLVARRRP